MKKFKKLLRGVLSLGNILAFMVFIYSGVELLMLEDILAISQIEVVSQNIKTMLICLVVIIVVSVLKRMLLSAGVMIGFLYKYATNVNEVLHIGKGATTGISENAVMVFEKVKEIVSVSITVMIGFVIVAMVLRVLQAMIRACSGRRKRSNNRKGITSTASVYHGGVSGYDDSRWYNSWLFRYWYFNRSNDCESAGSSLSSGNQSEYDYNQQLNEQYDNQSSCNDIFCNNNDDYYDNHQCNNDYNSYYDDSYSSYDDY